MTLAINALEREHDLIESKQSDTSMEEVLDRLMKTRTRLADLYMLEEKFKECITEYDKVIRQECRRGNQASRIVAESHFLIGNAMLYQDDPGCEPEAIK